MTELVDILEGAITEISAGRVLVPRTPEDRTWNDASERAMRILERYKHGEGLFQLSVSNGDPQCSNNS
jgi:hypothetical protein